MSILITFLNKVSIVILVIIFIFYIYLRSMKSNLKLFIKLINNSRGIYKRNECLINRFVTRIEICPDLVT